MKFPKSMHADGWAQHFEESSVSARAPRKAYPPAGLRPGARPVSAHTPLHPEFPQGEAAPVRPATVPALQSRASSDRRWMVGAGVAVLLVGTAVLLSGQTAPARSAGPVVISRVTPSPEDAQLRAAPPGAGSASAGSDERQQPGEPSAHAPAQMASEMPERALGQAGSPMAEATFDRPAPVVRMPAQATQVLARTAEPPVLPVPQPAAAPASPEAVPEAVAMPTSPALTAVPEKEDAGITAQVRRALAADAALAVLPIAVSTDHGLVRLEGQAPDALTRERASVVAAAADGVKGVDNRLTLPPTA